MFLTHLGIRHLSVLLGAILLVVLTGCGKNNGADKLVQVTGKLTVGGKPLPGAAVSFRPDANKSASTTHLPSGKTDEQGNYELTTIGKKGAPPGWYKVVVVIPSEMTGAPGSSPPQKKPQIINKKYAKTTTTDLSAEVKDGQQPLSLDFNLVP